MYRGVIADNRDPQKQRRAKLQVPQVLPPIDGKTPVTNWAYQMEATNAHSAVPAIGQGVWVMFVGGDPEHPVWFGATGNNKSKGRFSKLSPLPSTKSLSGLTSWIKTDKNADGSEDIDVLLTLHSLATEIVSLRARVAALEP